MNKYKLLIVESPHKAKTIQKYLGEGFKVTASAGHIMDLPKKELGVNLDNFKTKIVPMDDKKDLIKRLQELMNNSSEIFLATDDDREGEAIAFHLQAIAPKGIPIHRVLFNAITQKVVNEKIQNPGILNNDIFNAQKSRRILDRLMGYKISPLIGRKIKRGLSAGRVQSALLRMILEKELSIRNFISEDWFSIQVYLKKDKEKIKANFFGYELDSKTVIENKEDAEKIFNQIKNKEFNVKKITQVEKSTKPKPAFTTSKLQQAANSKLKFSGEQTMQIAQKLYEGIDVKNFGRTGLITYMRTDSIRIDEEYAKKARDYVRSTYGEDYLSDEIMTYEKKTKKKDDAAVQDAHEAIRPTNLALSPEKIKDSLDSEQFQLYKLIWTKFISSQMSDMKYLENTIFTECEGNYFKTVGKKTTFKGFQAAYQEKELIKRRKKGDEIIEDSELPILNETDVLSQDKEALLKENKTQAPSRYTEGMIVNDMEKKGVGRPATFVATIKGIEKRKYVRKKSGKFYITPLGELVCLVLLNNFKKEMKISYTAQMEKDLDKISQGKLNYIDFLKGFWTEFSKTLEEAKDNMIEIKPRKLPIGVKCEECDSGTYRTTWGKNGMFLSCNNYPECKSTKNVQWTEDNIIKVMEGVYVSSNQKVIKKHKDPCPKCDSEVGLIVGKFGKFYSCLDYPKCDFNMPYTLDIPCPSCNKGYMTERNYQGSTFYSCSRYPDCKFTLNQKPVKSSCPKCQYKLLTIKKEEKDKVNLICPSCKQNYSVNKNKKSK